MYDFGETALAICSGYSYTNVVAHPPFLGLSLEVHNAGVSPFTLKKKIKAAHLLPSGSPGTSWWSCLEPPLVNHLAADPFSDVEKVDQNAGKEDHCYSRSSQSPGAQKWR